MWVPSLCRGLGCGTCEDCSKSCVPSLGSDSLSRDAPCLLTSLPTTETGELRWLKTEVAKNSPFPEPAVQPQPVLACWLPSQSLHPGGLLCFLGLEGSRVESWEGHNEGWDIPACPVWHQGVGMCPLPSTALCRGPRLVELGFHPPSQGHCLSFMPDSPCLLWE